MTFDIYEDNGGTIWLVSETEGVAIDMGSDPDRLRGCGLTDCRLYRDSWHPEDFPDDLHRFDDVSDLLHDVQTRHLATYNVRAGVITLHRTAHEMGRTGQAYLDMEV